MTPYELALHDLDEIRRRLSNRTEYEFIQIAATIRRLFFDKSALLPLAVRQSGRKFAIYTNKDRHIDRVQRIPRDAIWIIGDQIGGERDVEIPIDDFGKQVLVHVAGEMFTVKDIVKYVANKRGGVHYDEELAEEQRLLDALSRSLRLIGYESVLHQVGGIGETVVESALRCGWIEK